MRLKLYRGWWYAVWREEGQTKRRALRTQDRDAANRALADYQRRLATPTGTVDSIYAAYLADKGTERATWAWKRLEPAFGSLRPDQVTRPTCRAYIAARRRDGVGDGTIRTELTFLRAALLWHNRATPAVVELPSKPPPADQYLTRSVRTACGRGGDATHQAIHRSGAGDRRAHDGYARTDMGSDGLRPRHHSPGTGEKRRKGARPSR